MFQAESCYKITYFTAFVASVKDYIEERGKKIKKRGKGWKELERNTQWTVSTR